MVQSADQPVVMQTELTGLPAGLHAIAVHEGATVEGGCSNAGNPHLTDVAY